MKQVWENNIFGSVLNVILIYNIVIITHDVYINGFISMKQNVY